MAWPIVEIGFVRIPEAIRYLGPDINKATEPALDEIAKGVIRLYKEEITAVDAIDTGFFINTVHTRFATKGERVIASDANYSQVIETGWAKRAGGQASYPGRFPATRAIARTGPVIENAFDRALRRR